MRIEKPPPPELEAPTPKDEPVQPKPLQPKTPALAAGEPPPTAAAEAGKVLTQEPDPEEPLDLTSNTFVSGPGDRFAGGTTASNGTSKTAVKDPRATGTGKGTGSGTKAGATGGGTGGGAGDQTRASSPVSRNWNCGFPPEADFDQVDYATVMISVTVGPDGRAKSVNVLSDPGHGFGRLAKSCASACSTTPATTKTATASTKTTARSPCASRAEPRGDTGELRPELFATRVALH